MWQQDLHQSQEDPKRADYGFVYLDGVPIRADAVQPVNLAKYQGKQTTGDYTRDSDDQQSALILGSFLGGGQKLDAIEGADDERFYDSTLETTYANQVSLNLKVDRFAGPNAVRACPIGDLHDRFYACFDKAIRRWNAALGQWDTDGWADLAAQPVRKGTVQFGSYLYIPLGSAGYARFDGATVTHDPDVDAIWFEVWDSKLIALTVDGHLAILVDPTGAWDAPDPLGDLKVFNQRRLPDGYKPRGMEVFWNKEGHPTLFILTDSRVFSYDHSVPKVFPTECLFPPHPTQGMGFTQWRSQDLLSGAGTGIYDYNGSVVSAVGLDRDNGLPAKYRGDVVDLEPEHNGVFALIEGEQKVVPVDEELWAEQGLYYDDPIELDVTTAESCIWQFTGGGWHNVWTSKGETGRATWQHVSTADGDYRMWWGFNGAMFTRKLRRSYHTPQQGMVVGSDRFEADGFLETPQYDFNMRGFLKVASHCEVYLRDGKGDGTSGGTVRVKYRTNFATAWQTIGSCSLPGRWVFPMGNVVRAVSEGVSFIWIQFRFEFEQPTGQERLSPVMDSVVVKFAKIPLSGRSWVVRANLATESTMGNDTTVIAKKLNDLMTTPRFVSFVHRNETFRVLASQIVGSEGTGNVPHGSANITLLEVSVPESSRTSAYGLETGGVP
ncbi:MAG: hypothetical protein WBA46_10045 [Thermomicrobiales bacterium]